MANKKPTKNDETIPMQINLPTELHKRAKKIASDNHISLSSAVRIALNAGLDPAAAKLAELRGEKQAA